MARRVRMAVLCGLAMAMAAGAVAVSACGGSGPTGDVGKITITHSTLDVTVTNTSGLALTNVRVEILPVGRATSYRTNIPRMDSGEHRDLDFSLFSDTDGVQFSPRNVRPTAMVVTAKDLDGKEYKVEAPWK